MALQEREPLPSSWLACTEEGCPGGSPGEGGKTPAPGHQGKKLSCWSREQGPRRLVTFPTRLRTQGGTAPPTRAVPVGLCPGRENLSGGWRPGLGHGQAEVCIHHQVRLVPDPETLPAHIGGNRELEPLCVGAGGVCGEVSPGAGADAWESRLPSQLLPARRRHHPASPSSWPGRECHLPGPQSPSLYKGTADAHPAGAWGGLGPAAL